MTTEIKITLVGSPGEIEAQKSALTKLAKLPPEDRDRISQLIQNPKALKALKDKWTMLKMMFM